MKIDDVFSDLLALENGESICTTGAWEKKRADIHKRFQQMLGSGPGSAKRPLKIKVCSETHCQSYIRKEIEFSVHEDERAHAYLHIPLGLSKPAPAVLCLQQTAPYDRDVVMGVKAKPPEIAYGKELAERGFVTLCADHFVAGMRVPAAGPFDTSEFYQRFPHWSAVGKSLWESQIALDILCETEEVDAERIGCMGHSLGGHSASFLAFYDQRIKCTVANCGNSTFRYNPGRLLWSRDHWYIYFPMLRPLFMEGKSAPADFHEIIAGIAPRPFLDISAFNEPAFEGQAYLPLMFSKIHEVYKLYGMPEKLASYMHGAGHGLFRHSAELAYAWLKTWLS